MGNDDAASVRRFHLIDAAILIAVVAISLATLRTAARLGVFPSVRYAIAAGALRREPREVLGLFTLLQIFYPSLATGVMGLLWVRLRRPRPRPARLWRQPGFVGLVAAGIVVSVNFVDRVGVEARQHRGVWVGWPSEFQTTPDYLYRFLMPEGWDSPQVGPAVASAWAVLALSGRWKAEASWIDRAGRVVGALWILVYLVPILASCLPK